VERPRDPSASVSAALHEKAAELRRSASGARARLERQRRELEGLRAKLAELGALAAQDRARASARVEKEAAGGSARVAAASLPTRRPASAWRFAPYAALAVVAAALQFDLRPAPAPAPSRTAAEPAAAARPPLPPLTAPAAPREPDDGAALAIQLAGDWRSPTDDRTLDERAGAAFDLPGAAPLWSADRTGETTYLVRRRADDGQVYEFEVDLGDELVEPTPETAERLSPPLVTGR
jgi:hypothetical protein